MNCSRLIRQVEASHDQLRQEIEFLTGSIDQIRSNGIAAGAVYPIEALLVSCAEARKYRK